MGSFTDQVAGTEKPAPVTLPGDEETPAPAPAAPPSSLTSRVLGDADTATRLGVATKAATDIPPDTAARVLALGDKTGLPLDMIQRNLDTVEKASAASDFDPEKFRNESPAVASWMAESPHNAALGHDDLPQLGMMEKLTRSIKGSFVGKSYESAMSQFELGNLRARQIDGQVLSPDEEKRAQELSDGQGPAEAFGQHGLPWAAKTVLEGGVQMGYAFLASRPMAMASALGTAGVAAAAQPELAPVSAPAAGAAGYLVGGAYGTYKVFSDMMRGLAYDKFLKIRGEDGQSIDPDVAKVAANVVGVTGGLIVPLLTIPSLVKAVPGGARAIAFLSQDAIAEALTKQSVRTALTEATKDLGMTATDTGIQGGALAAVQVLATEFSKKLSPGKFKMETPGEIATEIGGGAAAGAVMGAGLRIPMNVAAMTANFEQARQAAQNEATFQALGEAVKGSKTFQKLPAHAQDMVSRMTAQGPLETVYAPMGTWNSYWQGKGLEPREVARAVMGDTKAYDQAAAGGQDIPIPTAKYATAIAPTEHNSFFQSEIRTSPDGMNAREANEFVGHVDRVVQEGEKAKAAGAPAEDSAGKVVQNITDQLQAAGYEKPTADAYAKLWGSMFKTAGDRTKQDPFELFQKYGLKIKREDLQAMGEPTGPGSDVRGIPGQPNGPDVHPPLLRSEIPVPDVVSSTPLELPVQHPGEAPGSSIPFPAPSGQSFDESITQHPDFVKLTTDADALVRSYAQRRGVEPTPEFAHSLWQELHDALGDYKMAAKEKNTEKLNVLKEKYPDLSNEWLTLNAKITTDAEVQANETRTSKSGKGYFAKNVVGMTDAFRPKAALLAEQLAGSAQEPDMPLPTISEKDVMSRAQALLKQALFERELKDTRLKQFIDDVGGVQGYKKGLNGKKAESEEFQDVPLWARGPHPFDEVEEEAKKQGIIPANARYGALYEALKRSESKGFVPHLEDFIAQARRDAEHEAGYYQSGQGDLFPGTKSNVSETYDRLLKDAAAKGMTPKEARAYAMKKMASGDTGGAPEGGVQRQFDAGGVQGFGSGKKGAQELFQAGEPFYSQLQKTVEEKMPASAPVDQVRNILKGGSVKQEELDWSGVDEFLKGKEKVSKSDLLDFLRGNEVKVQEVVKGKISPQETERLNELDKRLSAEGKLPPDEAKEYNALTEAESLFKTSSRVTKFESYQLPGGENYREILLTLPGVKAEPKSYDIRKEGNQFRVYPSDSEQWISQHPSEDSAQKSIDARNFRDQMAASSGSDFKSSHFDEPNILAHVRMNDRTTADGKKMLFLEEVQSDWHQKGREQGYAIPKDAKLEAKRVTDASGTGYWEVSDSSGKFITNVVEPMSQSEAIDFARKRIESGQGIASTVPDAPFKKTWHELALKRMIRYAAENGYDKIGWTSGEQQAERYDLSKQVDLISGTKEKDGRVTVYIEGKNGERLFRNVNGFSEHGQKTLPAQELPGLIGKEAAQKLMDGIESGKRDRNGWFDLRGSDLKVGGEGMKGFYDQMIPSFLNKYTKKWGGRVGESEVPVGGGGERKWVVNFEDRPYRVFDTEAEARDVANRLDGVVSKEGGDAVPNETEKVHSLDVTPSMKESAMQGQALFQGEDANRGRIRFGDDRQFNIDLLKNADLSTFLHETGHFALEMMGDLAAHPDASEELKADYAAVLKHLGVETRDQVGREQHEEFAKSFEAYLMEGKAPSAGLRSAFAKFRAWMIAVYRKATNLGVTPSPEVKGVFDRLLASHDEIAAVESEQGVKPMFDDARAAGMSEDQAARYAKAVDAAKTSAEDELSSKLIRQQQREQKKWWQDTKDEVTSKVAEDVHQRHEFIAQSILSTGKMPDGSDLPGGMEPFKLSKQDIIADYGKERLAMLGKPYVYTAVGGIHPDVAAEHLGFGSGDELMTELARAGDMKKLIRDLTDEQMRLNFGDILKDGKLPEEAVKAVHNEKRSQLLQMELQHLASNDLPALKDVIRRVARPAPPLEVTQAKAQEIVAGQRVRDLTPLIYQQAEAREARNATEAMLRGDFKEAFAAKQRELLNHELFRESTKAKDQTDAIVEYMGKFDKASVRDRIGKAGGDYLDQIDAIRDRYDFRRSQSLTAIDRKKSLAAWAESQRALGYDVDIPAKLLDESQRQHYKDTTVEELSGVRDSVKTIEHLARVKNELLANERMRDLEQARDEVVASIQANHDVKFGRPDENLAPGLREKLMEDVRQGVAAHTKMEFLFNYLDGEKPVGPTWRAFFKPMADAEVSENQMVKESSDALNEIFGAYTKAERLKWFMDKVHIPEIGGPMTKANILMVGMNMGNDHNRQAVMDGYHWSEEQLKAVTDRLDGRDWKLVQDVIDHIGSYKQRIWDLEKKMTGQYPQEVEPTPIVTKHGTFKGGYFPLIFDPKLDFRRQALNEEGSVRDMFGGGWARAMTKTGHTEARTNSGGHPPLLQFTALVQHLQNVIHDLAFRPAVIDASRLANEPDVRANIVGAAGREMYNQIKPWIHAIAGDAKNQPANFMEGLLTRVRAGVTTASIGLKLTSGLVQTLDYGFTGKEIGAGYASKGLYDTFKNPANMKQAYDFIAERSPMMKGLIGNYERDVRDILKGLDVVGVNPGIAGAIGAYARPVQESFFHFIGYMHLAVAMPSWMGAYTKAMDGKVDNVVAGDEADAVDYADSVVRKTKGAGSVKDLAGVQRGSPAWKLFTMFYTNLSTRFNQLASTANQFGIERNVPKLVAQAAMIWFAPALLQDALRGRTPSTDDDGKSWAKWMARKELLNPFESIIGVRDIAHGLDHWFEKGQVDFQGSPALEVGKTLVGAAAAGSKAVSGEDLNRSDARNMAMAAGYILHLPSAQMFQTLSYLYDWMKGDQAPANPVEGIWRAAIAGKKK